MIFVIFFLGVFIGVGVGFMLALLGRLGLEEKYKREGVAKIDGEFYRITKINFNKERKDDECGKI